MYICLHGVCVRTLGMWSHANTCTQDLEGWKQLQEALGNKCLLVADRTLEGLSMSAKTGDGDAETEQGGGEGEGREEGERVEEEEGGLEYLSCVGLSMESTLSETCSRASCLRGKRPGRVYIA